MKMRVSEELPECEYRNGKWCEHPDAMALTCKGTRMLEQCPEDK